MRAVFLTLIFVSLTTCDEFPIRAKRAIEPFQPLVGATQKPDNLTAGTTEEPHDGIGVGVHSGAVRIAILVAAIVAAGVIIAVCFAWWVMPKDDPAERNPILRGHKSVDSRCHSHD
ncbi:hypothetical protein PFISCL1PPCAC_25810 [Pristionchus fissidentatus]|uniref:Uncharacterized protein n=1 Tax=Pristionchus fissidentatus TaxID=1538716 RepID=A0AAV5WW90_9BILA|nr:hypothetical protein PFISCL1PPCAC_25810 [Pristionchus fissidentatus]